MARKGLLLFVAAVLVAVVAAGCSSPKFTLAKYDQIQNGMTQDQVLAIIGSPGDESAPTDVKGTVTKTVKWKNSETSVLVVTFVNGKVTMKSLTGLK